jgi:hypothetical protein
MSASSTASTSKTAFGFVLFGSVGRTPSILPRVPISGFPSAATLITRYSFTGGTLRRIATATLSYTARSDKRKLVRGKHFPKGAKQNSPYRKKMDGTVVWRETGEPVR